jgi:hypothetical protein
MMLYVIIVENLLDIILIMASSNLINQVEN